MNEVKRKTKIYVKNLPQKTLCHYAHKCKSRSVVLFSEKERGRQPNDLGLCDKHAREMLEALEILYGKRVVSVTEQALIDATEVMRLASERIERADHVIQMIVNAKDRKLTWDIVSDLLSEDDIDYSGVANIRKGLDLYLDYHKPAERLMKEKAMVELQQEENELDLNGIDEEELTLESLTQDAPTSLDALLKAAADNGELDDYIDDEEDGEDDGTD